ncbi:MAG TPA: hypothetical protein VF085_01765 [Solirubrobacterales bacterium]
MTKPDDSVHYNVAIVEAAFLATATELHPQNLTAKELALKVILDPDDTREVETAEQAMRGLREFGLFSDGDGGIVTPTPAALHAVALFAHR